MTTRIVIADEMGKVICGIDGNHGAHHAEQWCARVVADIADRGVPAVAIELHPVEGCDAIRCGVFGNLHRLRAELRTLPDGRREIIGLNLYPEATPRDNVRAKSGAGAGLTKRQAAATPTAVRGALRVIAAPADIANPRAPIRIPHGRMNVPVGEPRTHAEIRHARRAARAAARSPRNP
jgi:hypothetical protein